MIELDYALRRGEFATRVNVTLDDSVTGVFGPSGAGKTTLLGTLAGLVRPDAGRLVLDGECLLDTERGIDLPLHKRRIGMVFQDSRLFPHLTVSRNLEYGYHRLPREQRRFSLAQIVELLELGALLRQKPHQLSGGQRQRVALGRALLSSPRLLLLDEPMASLDVRLKMQILPFMQRVRDEIDIPMLYVSHAIDEVLQLTSRMLVLEQGHEIGYGDFVDVMRDTQVLALARSLGMENVLQVELLSHHPAEGYSVARLGAQSLFIPLSAGAVGDRITISTAASNVALASEPVSGISIQNQLPGTLGQMRQVDHRMLVDVVLDAHTLVAEVSAKAIQDLALSPGMKVHALIKTQALHLYGQAL